MTVVTRNGATGAIRINLAEAIRADTGGCTSITLPSTGADRGGVAARVPGDPSTMNEIEALLAHQDGVIARSQTLAAGCSPTQVARLLRRRDWIPVHPGVYVNHTGPLTWRQRAWAAVLACAPAALEGWSAIRAHEGPGRRDHDDDAPIRVVVRHGRQKAAPDGVRVRGSRRFDESVQMHLSPPRQRYDDAIIELADRTEDDLRALAILADACGGRRTSATRLLTRMDTMSRLSRRSWLAEVLLDVAESTCSVLEQAYLARVERAHGLPRGLRQVEAHDGQDRRMLREVVLVRPLQDRRGWRQPG